MKYLDSVGSFNLLNSICFPIRLKRLDREQLFTIPTFEEEEFWKIIDTIKGTSKLKIRNPRSMYIPFKDYIYYKKQKKRYVHKASAEDEKDAKNRGFDRASTFTNVMNNFNGYNYYLPFINQTKNLSWSPANIMYFWHNIIDNRNQMHEYRYLLFTPDNMKRKVLALTAATKTEAFEMKNIYILFLYTLRMNYDEMKKLLVENKTNLIFTDYNFTFIIKYQDFPKTIKEFAENFFPVVRRLKTGNAMGDIDDDNDLFQDEEVTDDDSIEEDAIVEALDKAEDNPDEVDTIIEKLETKESEPEKEKVDKKLEAATKAMEVIDRSRKLPPTVHKRIDAVEKRYNKIREKNLAEITAHLEEASSQIIEPKKVVNSANRMNEFKTLNMDSQYAKTMAKKNRVDIGETFKKSTVPLFMSDYKEKDDDKSADTKSKIVSYKFASPDKDETHSFTVRVPELRDGKFLHINGSDKVMIRQKMALPIINLGDRVLFTTYFGKLFIGLTRGNLSKKVGKIKRYIKYIRKNFSANDLKEWEFTPAYYKRKDDNYLGSELLEITRYMSRVKSKWGYLDFLSDEVVRNRLMIGAVDGQPLYATPNDTIEDSTGKEIDILDVFTRLFDNTDDKVFKVWSSIRKKKETTVMSYSYIKLMAKDTPLVITVLHAMGENLLELLKELKNEYSLEYQISPFNKTKRPPRKYIDDEGTQLIFKDFVVDIKYKTTANRALLCYLETLDLSYFDSLQLTGLVDSLYDSKHIMIMENYRDFFFDDVATRSVMEEMGIPTDYELALLYANTMLFENDRTIPEVSLYNERMPSNEEIIQGILYKKMAESYIEYATKVKRGASTPEFSVERDTVLKELLTLPNVEESSKLNPVQHLDKLLEISNKGVSGVNEERAYTMPKRKWDKSFYGIMSDVSPYTKSSGINKRLAVNPNITDMKGYFDTKDPEDKDFDDSNIMSVSETLGTFAQKHDSTNRLAMGMAQFNHLLGTEGSQPALVTYGMDDSIAHVDSDFSYQMQDDGKVIEVNDRYVKVQYKNLKDEKKNPVIQVFNYNHVERNAAKSKFMLNAMELNNKVKKGALLKKGYIIAYNKSYYKKVGDDIIFKSGPIVYIACANIQSSHEDGLFLTEGLARKLATKTLKRIAIKLSPSDRIAEFAKFGPVKPQDILFKYAEGLGYENDDARVDMNTLAEYLMKVKKSNYRGFLRDVFVYYKLSKEDEERLHPSIRNFIKYVEIFYKKMYDTPNISSGISNFEKNRIVDHVTKFTGSKRNKINGDFVDKGEILIELFIEVEQPFTVGDKITFGNTALKGVASKIVKDSDAPYGKTTKRKIDAILSQFSPLARMVYSVYLNGYLNECMMKFNENVRKDILKLKE